jgi:hypothetical protein
MSAGAYGFTMSSNYNTRPRVAEVMVANTTHQLVRKRGLNACCVFFINGQNLVIGIVKTGAQKIIHSAINNGK